MTDEMEKHGAMVLGHDVPTREVAAALLDQHPDVVLDALERRGKNRTALLKWVLANLKEGTDFGVIKNKKSLWKPGAEKIAGMMGLRVSWPDLSAELDRMRAGANVIWLQCELIRDDQVVAQGAGARRLEDDGGDPNKAIKMAKKSAMIDAVLNAAGLSEVFTQDIEDDRDQAAISEDAQKILQGIALQYFGDQSDEVLQSLARRRFHFADGDWTRIPAYRFADAIRSIEEKGKQNAEKTTDSVVCQGCDGTGGPSKSCAGCGGTGRVDADTE